MPSSRCCRDVSFRVEAGATTAIIGSTGAGKTTLVNLVSRLFDATEGTVLVDGVDVRELDPDLLWGKVGYVPAEGVPVLRHGRIEPAVRAARRHRRRALGGARDRPGGGFVQAMPDGLESPIAQGGTNVSGGQRQRLSIARALVAQARDLRVRRLVLGARPRHRCPAPGGAAPHTADAAVLIVAQRVSTIGDADQILVLEDGQIVGRGTHDELVETCPTYAEIVESQIGEGAVA